VLTATLNNKQILVTRPEHQAGHLCELISQSAGESILFPTIEIQVVLNSDTLLSIFNNINEYDFIIFVSRNAVKMVFEHYIDQSSLLSEKIQLLAIGTGTAAALADMNLTDVLHAGAQADSENLLRLDELQSEFIQSKKILIVRGVGGRELLANGLKARDAIVDYAEVYKRCLPEYDEQKCHEVWQDNKLEAIIVSSNEGLNNLLELTPVVDQKQLFSTPLVVMSERTVGIAKEKGFIAEIGIAQSKNDEGLVSALLQLVGDQEV
jgi:uroporphyrinogen-III synthase